MAKGPIDIGGLFAANADFAAMYSRGDPWAMSYVSQAQRFNDGDEFAFTRKFDGKPRNWCGNCPDPQGCVQCSLPPPRTRAEVCRPFDKSGHEQ